MNQYHKINSVYKRDEKGNILIGQYSQPEFKYLERNEWWFTEKVDGTNIRFQYRGRGPMVEPNYYYGGPTLKIQGKTGNAQIPDFLLLELQKYMMLPLWQEKFGNDDVCLYGEGYGAKIQKGGGNYIPHGTDFILFDVKIGDFWLKREDIEEIAQHFGMKIVPILDSNLPLIDAIDWIKDIGEGNADDLGQSRVAETTSRGGG